MLVEDGSPYAGIAASVLAGPPLRAPILIGAADGVPEPTADALAKLNPRGGSGPGDAAVYRVGDVAAPSGYQSEQVGQGLAGRDRERRRRAPREARQARSPSTS